MPTSAPLQVLVFRHREDEDVLPYQDAIIRAFQGGKDAGNYLATGEDLGIQLEVYSNPPPERPAQTLEGFRHTMIVVLVDRGLLDKAADALWDWLAEYWDLARASTGRHALLAVPMDERVGDAFFGQATGSGEPATAAGS